MDLVIKGYAKNNQIIYVPDTDDRQKVVYPGELDTWEDEYGNRLANVTGNYSYTFHVLVDASKPLLWDDEYPPKHAKTVYLGDADYITASDPLVKERAKQIVKNTTSTLEAVALLTSWVHDSMEYNASITGPRNTKELLESMEGVCSEYATLYTALARAAGIPTRLTTGIANTGSGWVRHAWAESLVGGHWIPVEPTYKEAGTRNAMAVKLYSAPTYILYKQKGNIEEIEVENYSAREFNLNADIDTNISKTLLAPEEIFYLRTTITNHGETTIMPSYMVQKNVGITSVDSSRKIVVVGPGETKTLEWKFIGPHGEREEYVLFSKGPSSEKMFMVKVDPDLNAEKTGSINLREIFARGEAGALIIDVTVENTGNDDVRASVRVRTEAGTKSKNIDLNSGEKKVVQFSFPVEPGQYAYTITAAVRNETKTESGDISIVAPLSPQQSLLKALNQYVYSYPIYIIIVVIVLLVVITSMTHQRIQKPKKPFQEKSNWHKTMKIKKKKRP